MTLHDLHDIPLPLGASHISCSYHTIFLVIFVSEISVLLSLSLSLSSLILKDKFKQTT